MKQDVAIALDYEILLREWRSHLDGFPDLIRFIQTATQKGRIVTHLALADWTQHERGYARVTKAGFNPVHDTSLNGRRSPEERSAAFAIAVEAELILNPYRTFILACPSGTALPLARRIRAAGGRIVWAGFAGQLSSHLENSVDEVILLDDGGPAKKKSGNNKEQRSRSDDNDSNSDERQDDDADQSEERPAKDDRSSSRSSKDDRSQRNDRPAREDRPPAEEPVEWDGPDPYPILVEVMEATLGERKKLSLNVVKEALKERIEDFDETRIKDSKGRWMRRFKDFIQEASRMGLVKLRSRGRQNEVSLPRPDSEQTEAEPAVKDGSGSSRSKSSRKRQRSGKKDEKKDELLGTRHGVIDLITDNEVTEDEPEDDNETVPPRPFLDCLDEILQANNGDPMAITPMLEALGIMRRAGRIEMKVGEIRKAIDACINIELLEEYPAGRAMKYNLPEDWREVIEYL